LDRVIATWIAPISIATWVGSTPVSSSGY